MPLELVDPHSPPWWGLRRSWRSLTSERSVHSLSSFHQLGKKELHHEPCSHAGYVPRTCDVAHDGVAARHLGVWWRTALWTLHGGHPGSLTLRRTLFHLSTSSCEVILQARTHLPDRCKGCQGDLPFSLCASKFVLILNDRLQCCFHSSDRVTQHCKGLDIQELAIGHEQAKIFGQPLSTEHLPKGQIWNFVIGILRAIHHGLLTRFLSKEMCCTRASSSNGRDTSLGTRAGSIQSSSRTFS